MGTDVVITDAKGQSATYAPITIIHHSGEVIDDNTMGHYQADVHDKLSQQWFRTSNNQPPVEIARDDVTDKGYIFLYKKIS